MVGQPQSSMGQILWVLAHKRAGMSYPDLFHYFTQQWPAEPCRRNLTIASIQHIWTRYKDDPVYNQDWAPDQIAYILGRLAAGKEKADIVAGIMTRFPFNTWPQHVLKMRCLDYVFTQYGDAQYNRDWDKHDIDFILERKLKGLTDEAIVRNFFLDPTFGRELREEEVEYSHHSNVVESIEEAIDFRHLPVTKSPSADSQMNHREILFAQDANLRVRKATSTPRENVSASVDEQRGDVSSPHGIPLFPGSDVNSLSLMSNLDPALFQNDQDNFVINPQPSLVHRSLPGSGEWTSTYPNSLATSVYNSPPLTCFQPSALSSTNRYLSISPISDEFTFPNNASPSTSLGFSEASHLPASALGGHNDPISQHAPVSASFAPNMVPGGPTINNLQFCTVMQTPSQYPPELMYLPAPHDLYYCVPDEAKAKGLAGRVVWDVLSGGFFLLADRLGSGEAELTGWPLMMWKLNMEGYLVPYNHQSEGKWKLEETVTGGSEAIERGPNQDSSGELNV